MPLPPAVTAGKEVAWSQVLDRVAVVVLFVPTVIVLRVLFHGSAEANTLMESLKTFAPLQIN